MDSDNQNRTAGSKRSTTRTATFVKLRPNSSSKILRGFLRLIILETVVSTL